VRLTKEQYEAIQNRRKASSNKFGAVKKSVHGIAFDSTKEANRYMVLKADPLVSNLRLQVPIQVHVRDVHVFTYLCDFVYDFGAPGEIPSRTIHEDAKGYRKGAAYQLFRLKKAVIKAAMGIDIEEV
jgi:hypothetical protein